MKRADQDKVQHDTGLIAFEDEGTEFPLGKTIGSKAEKATQRCVPWVNPKGSTRQI